MDIGINIGLIFALAAIVMPGVNYYKGFYPGEIKPWNARLASLILSFIVVYLVTYNTVPFVWQTYVMNSLGTALIASGYWDGTTQIGNAIGKVLAKVNNRIV